MSTEQAPSHIQKETAKAVQNSRYVRTHLIHRRSPLPGSWWHAPVIAEIPGIIDKAGAKPLASIMPIIKETGFDGVVFRPALLDFYTSKVYLDQIIEAGKQAGLRVIVRLSGGDYAPDLTPSLKPFYGAEESTATTITRAREALKSGADGIDLGRIAENPNLPGAKERDKEFADLVRLLMFELADFSEEKILVAEARTELHEQYQYHLQEDWIHNFIDNRLQRAPFSDTAIIEAIEESLFERDKIGVPPVWKAINSRLIMEPDRPNNYPGSWEDGTNTTRRSSMRIILASLPGAIYLPFGFSGGHVTYKGVAVRPLPPINSIEERRLAHTQLALRLRKKYDLGNANLAWVSGLPWQTPGVGVFTSGSVMCVFNTSNEDVFVPLENELLLRSDSTREWALPGAETVLRTGPPQIFSTTEREEQNTLTPGTTAWFIPPVVNASNR